MKLICEKFFQARLRFVRRIWLVIENHHIAPAKTFPARVDEQRAFERV